ncbi:hypothetical protein [Sinomonas sp. ASV322]|nr:hypothetical protein [Sinomonas sp. ASV322]MDQ4500756.1 hypothetical protein [Sinomonas sp. ASV322]
MRQPENRPYSFEFKLGLVQRFLGWEASADKRAQEHGVRNVHGLAGSANA